MQLDDEINLSKSYEFESYCVNFITNKYSEFILDRKTGEEMYKKELSSEKSQDNVTDVIHAVKESIAELCKKHNFEQLVVIEDSKHVIKIKNLVLNIELDRDNKTISINSSRYIQFKEDEKDKLALLQFSFDEYGFFLFYIEHFFDHVERVYNIWLMEEKDAVAAMDLIKTTIGKADLMLLEIKNNYLESEIQFVKDYIRYDLVTVNKAVLADSQVLIDFLKNPTETINDSLASRITYKGYGLIK